MIYCRECGNKMEGNRRFCTDCAAPLDKEIDRGLRTRRVEEAISSPARQRLGPGMERGMGEEEMVNEGHEGEPLTVKTDSDSNDEGAATNNMVVVRSRRALRGRSAVVTTGGFVGILMLMLVPLVNLMALIIWAMGGCKKIMKQNFARAVLLMTLFGLVLAGVNHIYGDVIAKFVSDFVQNFGISAAFSGFFRFLENMGKGIETSGELMLRGINRLLAFLGMDVIG